MKPDPKVKQKAKRPKSRVWRALRWTLVRFARLTLVLLALAVFWVGVYRFVNPPTGIYMASEFARLGGIQHEWRPLDQIAPDMVRAVVAAEDARFCDHFGFDLEAIEAALDANRQGRRLRGGSTISQQVAKNVFLWHERSWLRKGLEAGFTVLIEGFWPKHRIVEVYLNMAEFGEGVFGIEAGAQSQFGLPAVRLNLTQASRMAAVLPNPKERAAGSPSSSVRSRGRSIADGARTLKAEGRDRCLFD
ncbi:MAG: monofunctional biosynthetic peptidoglycan transglycosylase [Pseudomonadota bacterium]